MIGQVKLHASNQAVTNTQQELQSVKRKNANLKADLTQLNDPTYLQMILRDKYGYTKKGELIYNLPDKN
ncbi:FtsB family cell division protein [Leuconostoc fallax]|uniref:FtsB family cell division protein n=1 Tax=Leuconostoc fallax TaxID=1251 RepID=UPI00020D99F9|nr:septum formation initiator family protein [Leuconostoc fallax]